MNFDNVNLNELNTIARYIFERSDVSALNDLFPNCESVDDINEAAEALAPELDIYTIFGLDMAVCIPSDRITEYKTDDLYYEQAYQLDDGRWIAFDEAVNAWVMLG